MDHTGQACFIFHTSKQTISCGQHNLISQRNCKVLLFRPRSPHNLQDPTVINTRGEQASVAANIITRIAEDLLAAGMIQQVLIHMYGLSHILDAFC
jgi:hypothetical protein